MAASIRLAASFAALVALAACTSLQQYRRETVEKDPQTGKFRDRICAEQAPNSSSDVCALEHRTYTYGGAEHDYYFATVEFDDQGWFWDRRQMEGLLRFLYDYRDEAGKPGEFLIFAHAHGWQHRADACDNNVVCFQRLLERLDVSERTYNDVTPEEPRPPRKVVGIFIAWRGKSGTVPKLNATTFWSRKRAGNRVGIGGVTELLTRLDDYRRLRNKDHRGDKTQLVISGHSFGGQVIYKALAEPLIERATSMVGRSVDRRVEGDYGYEVAKSIGDLVVLVNPAFEGSAFESLQFAATNRCYPERQRPVMLVVTSVADQATRLAFPAGRAFSNLFSRSRCPDQRKAIRHTVGHLERYETHQLKLKGVEAGRMRAKKRKEGACGCPYLGPIEEFQMESPDRAFLLQLRQLAQQRGRADGRVYELGGQEVYGSSEEVRETSYGVDSTGQEMVLDRSPDYAANYPYLVISTDANFIPSHSAIYGERFTDFLRRFYLRHLAAQINFPEQCFKNSNPECIPSDITPCDRSWKPRLEYGCGGTPGGGG
jgi:hypothetical protein